MSKIATTPGRRHTNRRTLAVGVLAALVLSGCGSSGGDDAKAAKPAEAKTTTTAATATTTEASSDDGAESADGLPTEEADAPSGDWIAVRFLVAQEPEPDDFNKGSAEARIYTIEPDCSGGDACSLDLAPGSDDDGFAMPGTEPIEGEDIALEPDGTEWTDTYTYPDDVGCTDELDGPYLTSTEKRTMEPVRDDEGSLTGMVGTVLFTDKLTDEGRAAGCPASAEATYAYAVVASPGDGLDSTDPYTVDGTFRQTLEVTDATRQSNPLYQKGGISTTFPKYDAELAGSCEGGECSVDFSQLNGDDLERRVELTSEDGRALGGTYEEGSGCSNPDTGDTVFESGAYRSTGTFEDLTPIWIEDGVAKAFVGRYIRNTEPTELGRTDPSCTESAGFEAWTYLVDTDVLE